MYVNCLLSLISHPYHWTISMSQNWIAQGRGKYATSEVVLPKNLSVQKIASTSMCTLLLSLQLNHFQLWFGYMVVDSHPVMAMSKNFALNFIATEAWYRFSDSGL